MGTARVPPTLPRGRTRPAHLTVHPPRLSEAPYPTAADAADWAALRRGEHAALERLYRAHAPALLAYGRRFADEAAVEDGLHELFVRLWDRRAALNPDVQPRPYLLIALRNDLLRAVKRARRTDTTDDLPLSDAAPSAEAELVSAEEGRQRSSSLRDALATLSPRERELVTLRFEQSLDYDAIVEVTGISYQSARNTLARAIGKLRQRVELAIFLAALGTAGALATHLLGSPAV